jgi:hypothetical protein
MLREFQAAARAEVPQLLVAICASQLSELILVDQFVSRQVFVIALA